jgi:hypothetical protein
MPRLYDWEHEVLAHDNEGDITDRRTRRKPRPKLEPPHLEVVAELAVTERFGGAPTI